VGADLWPPPPAERTSGDAEVLANLERMNTEAWQRISSGRPGSRFEADGVCYLHADPIPVEALNELRVFGPVASASALLARAHAFFAEPRTEWRVTCASTWATGLEAACLSAGLLTSTSRPVLLRTGRPPSVRPLPGVRFERAGTEAELRTFARAFAQVNGVSETDFWSTPCLLELPGLDLFTGFAEGEAVATGLGYTASGVTGVWAIGTLPSHRGRGIGTGITTEVIRAGAQRGARATVLWSTEMGFPIYRALGFRHVGNDVVWTSRNRRASP
jgi:GNAT superfamily N-acetyltransferase